MQKTTHPTDCILCNLSIILQCLCVLAAAAYLSYVICALVHDARKALPLVVFSAVLSVAYICNVTSHYWHDHLTELMIRPCASFVNSKWLCLKW